MIRANSLNSLVFQACEKVLKEGKPIHSRNGLCWELLDVDFILENPKARYLYLDGRTSNPFATFFETIWVFSGYSHLDELCRFIPRVYDYSDDGKNWRGAYGIRIYKHGQIDSVIEHFKQDLNTRRAVMTIWQPEYDTQSSIREQGFTQSKDIPCSQWLGFWIRDDKLFVKLQMRSNDLIFGFSHINVFEFTTLQEIIKIMLESNLKRKLKFGYYHHSVVSFHLYDFSKSQAQTILYSSSNYSYFLPARTRPLLPESYTLYNQEQLLKLFRKLYDLVVFSPDFSTIEKELEFEGIAKDCELYWWVVFSALYYRFKFDKKRLVEEGEKMVESCKKEGNEETARCVAHYLNRVKAFL